MSRGIIRNSGSGGVGGKLIVSNFDPKAGLKAVMPGTVIDFKSTEQLGVGYLVDGVITTDGSGHSVFTVNTVLNSKPNVVTSKVTTPVTVGQDDVYYFKRSSEVTGTITMNGGNVVIDGAHATGSITISENSSILCISNAELGDDGFLFSGSGANTLAVVSNCKIHGDFSSSGITAVGLGGNTVEGNITSDGDSYVNIANNSIEGNLTVKGVTMACMIFGNSVSGSTSIDPKCQK